MKLEKRQNKIQDRIGGDNEENIREQESSQADREERFF